MSERYGKVKMLTPPDFFRIGKQKAQSPGEWGSLIVSATLVLLGSGLDAIATEPVTYDQISSEGVCSAFDEAPICIAKTWKACTAYRVHCDLIGLPTSADWRSEEHKRIDLKDERSDSALASLRNRVRTAAWAIPYSEIVAAGNYEAEDIVKAILPVAADRMGVGKTLPKVIEGTVEVAMSTYVEDTETADSVFVKQVGNKWQLVAQHGSGAGFGYTEVIANTESAWREACDMEMRARSPSACTKFVYGLPPFASYLKTKNATGLGKNK